MARIFTGVACLLSSLLAGPPASASGADGAAAPECHLSPADARWAQRVVDDWDAIATRILGLPEAPLPWTVLYDAHCTWHLAADSTVPTGARSIASPVSFRGAPVSILASPHGDTVRLPGGRDIPAEPRAFTRLYSVNGKQRPYFVLAMPSLWRERIPSAEEGFPLEGFFLGVAGHEMTHTLQLVAVEREIQAVRDRFPLPEDLSDAAPEERFGKEPGYAEALNREEHLFLQAAAAESPAQRRAIARRALRKLRERRQRFFTQPSGTDGGWGRLEDIFLGLEGAAVWTHYRLAQTIDGIVFLPNRPEAKRRADVLAAMEQRGSGEWVQDEGFLIFLLIDELVPNWRRAAFGADPPSPVRMLENALHGDATGDEAESG